MQVTVTVCSFTKRDLNANHSEWYSNVNKTFLGNFDFVLAISTFFLAIFILLIMFCKKKKSFYNNLSTVLHSIKALSQCHTTFLLFYNVILEQYLNTGKYIDFNAWANIFNNEREINMTINNFFSVKLVRKWTWWLVLETRILSNEIKSWTLKKIAEILEQEGFVEESEEIENAQYYAWALIFKLHYSFSN